MIFRFIVRENVDFDRIEILKKQDGNSPAYVAGTIKKDCREFNDEFHKDGNKYAYQLMNCEKILFTSPFRFIEVRQEKTICLSDLFHSEELKSINLPNNSLVAVVHQNGNANAWYLTTRSWLVRVNNNKFTISDDVFYPKAQAHLDDYEDIESGNLFFVPLQMFEFLSYMSMQIEKAEYNYPKSMPRNFSFDELIMCLEAATGRFNSIQPSTKFGFRFSTNFNDQSVPNRDKHMIVRLATIEAIQALIMFWINFEFQYSEGISLDVSKREAFQSYRSELNDVLEEIKILKSSYLGRPTFLGSKFGFAAPFGARVDNSSLLITAPSLLFLRDVDGARNGLFERSLKPGEFLQYETV